MTKKLQHIFALSEKGAKDLVKAVIWCFVCNLSLMLPVGAVLFTVQHLLCLQCSISWIPWKTETILWMDSGSIQALERLS